MIDYLVKCNYYHYMTKVFDLTKDEQDCIAEAERRKMVKAIARLENEVKGLRRQVFVLNESIEKMK